MKKSNFFFLAITVLVVLFAVACTNEPIIPEYVVSFDPAGGSEVSSITVKEGATVAKPSDPAKDGFLLAGWYLGDEEYSFDTPVTSDITLKAVWGKAVSTEDELKAAIAEKTPIISLNNDIKATANIVIDNGITMVIDLHGKNIELGNNRILINAYGDNKGANLNIIGKGKISSTGNFVFLMAGASAEDDTDKIYLSISKDSTISGDYAISVVEDGSKCCYGVTVDIDGTVEGVQPVYVSGNIHNTERAPQINILGNAKISGNTNEKDKDPTIYIAGYSRVVIAENAEIISDYGNAIDVAAGEVEINGAVLTGGNTSGFDSGSGGSITTNTASAVLVKQHSTNLPINVVVNSGKFSAFTPFSQEKGMSKNGPKPELVKIAINGGEFTCTSETDEKIAVKSDDKVGFITGGTFSVEPDSKYIATGYEAKQSGDSWSVVKSAE